ncbi:heptaprenyl diphosphate synthase component 1 [Domibacillus epiphyticus]|uniref:Heptaprenyl diphosphate synthase n=1 Tax=Domibacillus epiphyticus TaxID=1714355 RepID=A0A1V2A4L3_9BACI|nr:heptaprenyl diphosphate synthase component 1 [Domibacillus epiphyticus]OMP65867.1 hypothetical protein BTO28_15025 [Domibacillus epiphyticus]
MGEWQNEQKALTEEINRTCSQPFLEKVIGAPEINPLRVSALMLAFSDQERTETHVKKQMTAAVLIQLALDTHDRIEPDTAEITQKHQLIVLAGDYFSGMYYRTLAEAGCIEYVRLLAEAVKNVNEMKTNLHQKDCTSASHIFHTVRTIETDIIRAVLQENEADVQLIEAVSSLLTADRLKKEKDKPSFVHDALLHVIGDPALVMNEIDNHLHELRSSILKQTQTLEEKTAVVLRAEYDRIFDRELRYAEEG